jgi:hypothetical protein
LRARYDLYGSDATDTRFHPHGGRLLHLCCGLRLVEVPPNENDLSVKLIHIDADRTGSASIQHLVPQWVETYSCPSLEAVAQVVSKIEKGVIRGDIVALDTLTRLTADTREDIVIDPAKVDIANLWKQRAGLKSSRDDYYTTMSLINRILRAIYNLPIPSIILAHERVRQDPLSGLDKFVPDLQDAINATVFTSADYIARLSAWNGAPFEYGGGTVQPGTRLLYTSATGNSSAGGRATPDHPIPPFLVGWQAYSPTFGDLINTLGYMPHNTIIYGPPKIGKTTFAGSVVYL